MNKEYKYLDTKEVVEKYPFSMSQVRHHLLMRHKNGLDRAIRKVGKKILIREDLFIDWIEKHQQAANKDLND